MPFTWLWTRSHTFVIFRLQPYQPPAALVRKSASPAVRRSGVQSKFTWHMGKIRGTSQFLKDVDGYNIHGSQSSEDQISLRPRSGEDRRSYYTTLILWDHTQRNLDIELFINSMSKIELWSLGKSGLWLRFTRITDQSSWSHKTMSRTSLKSWTT